MFPFGSHYSSWKIIVWVIIDAIIMLWSLNIILIGLEVITLDMNHKKKEEISHQIKNHVTY